MASSSDSSNLYNGDDARCYLHEQNEAMGHHWEATRKTKCLEATLHASQIALVTMEGESSAAREQLVESDARVAGKILRGNSTILLCCAPFDDCCSSYYSPDRAVGGTGDEQCHGALNA